MFVAVDAGCVPPVLLRRYRVQILVLSFAAGKLEQHRASLCPSSSSVIRRYSTHFSAGTLWGHLWDDW